MPKPKRPPWFKMFLRHKALFEALSDEDAGVAIKAVMDYFESGQIARDVSPAVNVMESLGGGRKGRSETVRNHMVFCETIMNHAEQKKEERRKKREGEK